MQPRDPPAAMHSPWLSQPLARWLAAGFVLLLLYSALIPFQVDASGWQGQALGQRVVWVPYRDATPNVLGLRFSLLNSVANALVALPVGWFAFRACPQRWPRGLALLVAAGVAALTGAGMEVLQLGVPGREVTMTDVANITLGGIVGALAAWWTGDFVGAGLTSLLVNPDRRVLSLWLLFLLLRSLFPDDVATSVEEFRKTLKKTNVIPGQIPRRNLFAQLQQSGARVTTPEDDADTTLLRPAPLPYATSLLGQALLFGLVGACLQRVRQDHGVLTILSTAVAVFFLALGVEFGKVFLPTHRADVNAALAGMIGGWLGIVAWLLLPRRGPTLSWAVGITVVAYVATQFLGLERSPRPLTEEHLTSLYIIPDMLQGMLLFVPLGWLVGEWLRQRWPPDNHALVGAPLASVALAGVLVLLQMLLGRTPTLDDVLWAGLGGWGGSQLQAWTVWSADATMSARRGSA